jgi:ATP adenylyltransferase
VLAILKPGTLWPAILRQTEHALRCGALRPIDTTRALIEQAGIRFVVRQVSSLTRKEATREAGGANRVKAEERNATRTCLSPISRTRMSPCSTNSMSSTITC